MSTLSVGMPNYNEGNQIETAIQSILEQSRPPEEILIYDDGSTDQSKEIIKHYAEKSPRVDCILSKTNKGVVHAVKRLFEASSGEYFYDACADDRILPGFFSNAMEILEDHPGNGLIYGDVVYKLPENTTSVEESFQLENSGPIPRKRLEELFFSTFGTPSKSSIYKREAFSDVGGYHRELGPAVDSFLFRAIVMRHGACYLSQRCVEVLSNPHGFSSTVKSDPIRTLDFEARTVWLMGSPEFRDDFPQEKVQKLHRRFRRNYIQQFKRSFYESINRSLNMYYLSLSKSGPLYTGLGVMIVEVTELLKVCLGFIISSSLHCYSGDTSCYTKNSPTTTHDKGSTS